MDAVSENHTLKDSFFSSLFYTSEEGTQNAIELYEALSGRKVQKARKCRLEQVFFNQMRNDISYEFDDRIVCFVEQQSTINNNMPFRLLMYLGRVYELLTNSDSDMRFRTKLYKIPTPEFYVLYNGDGNLKQTELQLNDAFMEPTDSLQLKVKVIDIRPDALKKAGLDKCKSLFGYSTVVEKTKEIGAKDAISYCIQHNILENYLYKYGSEVFNMLFVEYDAEAARRVRDKEVAEDAIAQERRKTLDAIKEMLRSGTTLELVTHAFKLTPEEEAYVTSNKS